jgi:hypothetical protein
MYFSCLAAMLFVHVTGHMRYSAARIIPADTSATVQVLVFSKKAEPSVLMRSMAMHFAQRLDFALIAADVTGLQDQFNAETVPAVVVRLPSGDVQHYTGALNAPALSDFLRRFAPERVADEVNRRVTICFCVRGFEHSPTCASHAAGRTSQDALQAEAYRPWLVFIRTISAL